MARMHGSGVRGATRLDGPEDDWLGELSDYDWSESTAEDAKRGPSAPPREGLVAAVDDTDPSMPPPAGAADAHRALVERRRIVAGLVVAAVLGVAIVIALVLFRGGSEPPVTDQTTTTSAPTTTTPSSTPSTTPETPAQKTPGASDSSTPPANGSSFTLPEGTKLRLGEGDPALVRQLQQTLVTAGYDPGAVDGTFGQRTEAAVTAFQQDNGLSADGVVGPDTASALNSAVAAG
jgi:Putative peptidoglycan binding domain